ncbi:MAG TPA: hypothetical protein VMN60_10995 [Longimicrobiales bacterium]|nr:hypothetical protein [Longimicrobiales bacterium]
MDDESDVAWTNMRPHDIGPAGAGGLSGGGNHGHAGRSAEYMRTSGGLLQYVTTTASVQVDEGSGRRADPFDDGSEHRAWFRFR